MKTNPKRRDLSYWNKDIRINDDTQIDSSLGPIKIGRNYYYGHKISHSKRACIVFGEIIPVLFLSIVLAPLMIPLCLHYDTYRRTCRLILEVHYGRKLKIINNIAHRIIKPPPSQSTSSSSTSEQPLSIWKGPQNIPPYDSNGVPLEILNLIFSSVTGLTTEEQIKEYFVSIPLVCKAWWSQVEKAKINMLNTGAIYFRHLFPNSNEKRLLYINRNFNQLKTINTVQDLKILPKDFKTISKCIHLENLIIKKAFSLDINQFSNLKRLYISETDQLNFPALRLPLLTILKIQGIIVETLPQLLLPQLKELEICFNISLITLPPLDALSQLHSLVLFNNDSLNSLPSFKKLNQLKKLWISETALTTFPSMEGLTQLKKLRISNNRSLSRIETLDPLINLKKLLIYDNTALDHIASLNPLSELKSLEISGGLLETLPDFQGLNKLKTLALRHLQSIQTLDRFEKPLPLRSLVISSNPLLQEISSFAGLSQLTSLFMVENGNLSEIPSLTSLIQLEELYISSNQSLKELPDLRHLTKLQFIEIDSNPFLRDNLYMSELFLEQKEEWAKKIIRKRGEDHDVHCF